VAAVFASALVSGGWLMQAGYEESGVRSPVRARLLNQVLTHVEKYYVDTVSEDDLYRKAVDGMLLELHDPHSVYLPPDRLAKLNESTTGRALVQLCQAIWREEQGVRVEIGRAHV